jgi:outer membrane lipoprotein-sorting protein
MSAAGQTVRLFILCAALAGVAVAGHVTRANAADAKDAGKAVGASNWGAKVGTQTGAAGNVQMDEKQAAAMTEINAYFNNINELRGKFLQTDAEQQQQKGDFYIKRPGKFRFVYGAPSQLAILSDGETLSFEDYDLKHADRYPVDSTPFRLLLAKDVNLTRDADIKELTTTDDLVTMTLQDKISENQGQIQLFFVKTEGKMELKEWVIAGPQGDNTRVEIANLVRDKPADPKYFENAPLELEATKNKH